MSERVRVGLRVPSQSVEAFNSAVKDEFGQRKPYAPVELEREIRTWVESDSLSRVHNTITALGGVLESPHRKKKSLNPPRGETEIVQYHIGKSVRAEFMQMADDDERSAGTIVGDLMYQYAADGDAASREADRLGQLVEVANKRTTEESVSGEVKIANNLNQPEFSMSELEEAIKDAGYSTVSYAKEQYLAGVLDELDSTWHPESRELFVSQEADFVPDNRDPRSKPYVLMTDSDKQDAIKRELEEKNSGGRMVESITLTEVINVLHGRPQRTTARQLCEEIAKSDDYKIKEKDGWNEIRLAISHGSTATNTPTPTSNSPTTTDSPPATAETATTDADVNNEFEQLEQAQPVAKTDGGYNAD